MAREHDPQDEILDMGNFPAKIAKLCSSLWTQARQGASPEAWLDQQAMCVVEECGEALEAILDMSVDVNAAAGRFIGAYRRWRGFARRSGPPEDVEDEMGDIIIATACMMVVWSLAREGKHIHDDGGTVEGCPGCFWDPEEAIRRIVEHKLEKIFTRGYISKQTAQEQQPEPTFLPDHVYMKRPDGSWEDIGLADTIEFQDLEPPYTVALGRTFVDREPTTQYIDYGDTNLPDDYKSLRDKLAEQG